MNAVNPTVVMTAMGKKAWSDPTKAAGMLARIPTGRFAGVCVRTVWPCNPPLPPISEPTPVNIQLLHTSPPFLSNHCRRGGNSPAHLVPSQWPECHGELCHIAHRWWLHILLRLFDSFVCVCVKIYGTTMILSGYGFSLMTYYANDISIIFHVVAPPLCSSGTKHLL